jgi:hypothetical protein
MNHPLIHFELARTYADDIDRRTRAPRLATARRRSWRQTARRIIRALPVPVPRAPRAASSR